LIVARLKISTMISGWHGLYRSSGGFSRLAVGLFFWPESVDFHKGIIRRMGACDRLIGRLPDNPPAPLEDIIDSAVKTGADLSQVVSWNYANSRQILERGTPIPALLHKRLSVDWSDKENRPPRARVSGLAPCPEHWLDRLERGVREHIRFMQARRDELVAQA
jgi:hypothetical protein